MAGHRGIVVRVLSWNLFHGRDLPGEVDWKRPLRDEFAAMIAGFDWDVALLQEAPPRFFRVIAARAGANGRMVKTSRNQLGRLRGWIADRWPDLIKSGEGGSNQVLVRPPWTIAESRRLTLAWLPERRRMMWLRLEHPSGRTLCVANLHATAHDPPRSARELQRAADTALEWSGDRPLLLGGDFNTRPSQQGWVFERLAGLGFSRPTAPTVIDHLLVRGAHVVDPPRRLPPERRDVTLDGARVRLSDHAVVTATVDVE